MNKVQDLTSLELADLIRDAQDEMFRRRIVSGDIILTDAEVYLLGMDRKIHAIKSVRARYAESEGGTVSLRNAKLLVDTYQDNIEKELAGTWGGRRPSMDTHAGSDHRDD